MKIKNNFGTIYRKDDIKMIGTMKWFPELNGEVNFIYLDASTLYNRRTKKLERRT